MDSSTELVYIRNTKDESNEFDVDSKNDQVKVRFNKYGEKCNINANKINLIFTGRSISERKKYILEKVGIRNKSFIFCLEIKK